MCDSFDCRMRLRHNSMLQIRHFHIVIWYNHMKLKLRFSGKFGMCSVIWKLTVCNREIKNEYVKKHDNLSYSTGNGLGKCLLQCGCQRVPLHYPRGLRSHLACTTQTCSISSCSWGCLRVVWNWQLKPNPKRSAICQSSVLEWQANQCYQSAQLPSFRAVCDTHLPSFCALWLSFPFCAYLFIYIYYLYLLCRQRREMDNDRHAARISTLALMTLAKLLERH